MIFTSSNVDLNVDLKDKTALLKHVANMAESLNITDSMKDLYDSFVEREKEYSTGLEDGFAIPHAKSICVNKVSIIYVRLKNPIEWKTYDDKPVTDVFALMVPPENAGNDHLKILAKLSIALLEDEFKINLRKMSSEQEVAEFISKEIGVQDL